MHFRCFAVVLFSFACAVMAAPEQESEGALAADAVVLSFGNYEITVEDIERYIVENIPEDKRDGVLMRQDIYREMAETLYMVRALADEALAEEAIDKEQAAWGAMMAHQRRLVGEYRIAYLRRVLKDVNWESAVNEVYRAEPQRFSSEEQVSASHILIGLQDRSDEEALQLAQELRNRIAGGEQLADLAREFSEDPSAETNSGDMGFFGRGKMVPAFEAAAFALQNEGDLSEPVKSDFGYHIIQFNGRLAPKLKPLSEVYAEILEEIQTKRADQLWQDKIITMRSVKGIALNEELLEKIRQQYTKLLSPVSE